MAADRIQTINESIDVAFNALKTRVPALKTEPVNQRKKRLQKLRLWIHENRSQIHEAMYADFNKPPVEVDGIELFHVLNEISFALRNLDAWVKTKKIDTPLTMLGTRSSIRYEPRGVCLIISPWNYPFSLAVGPLISALAAGNAVILKPSELTPRVSALLVKMADAILDEDVRVFEGGPEVSQYLLSLPFDHIFFTGSPAIGKLVMKAAAENLASVTLELGGKSPAIVTDSANVKEAAQRIAVTKFVNNGQTCLAPDYVLADEKTADAFISELIAQTTKRFAANGSFALSASYGRIVNERHFTRLDGLLQDAIAQGAKTEWSGNADQSARLLDPVVLSHVPMHARVMQEEIFGPILPVVTYKRLEEAINIINSKPKPLGLYVFTQKKDDSDRILEETSSGGACINDCGIHFLNHHLPFGGVNTSGIGKSHGYYGFLAFSNEKPVLKQKSGFTSISLFYPPYTVRSKKIMDWFLKRF